MRLGGAIRIHALLLVVATATVLGHYDRSGPQHRITWGRGNSHTSAVFGIGPTNVTAVVERQARLPCVVKNLGHKDVSWIRQRDLHILTVATYTYTTDDRFKVYHQQGTEQWDLVISSVTFRDAGVYECQVSTSPKASLPITLNVLEVQQAIIPGPKEVYIQTGSTINLWCEVAAGSAIVGDIQWLHGTDTLNYSSPRGGISMEVEKTPDSTTSKLYITRATRSDSGNYTCASKSTRAASVLVHVVDAGEESAAAVHSGCAALHHIRAFKSTPLLILQNLNHIIHDQTVTLSLILILASISVIPFTLLHLTIPSREKCNTYTETEMTEEIPKEEEEKEDDEPEIEATRVSSPPTSHSTSSLSSSSPKSRRTCSYRHSPGCWRRVLQDGVFVDASSHDLSSPSRISCSIPSHQAQDSKEEGLKLFLEIYKQMCLLSQIEFKQLHDRKVRLQKEIQGHGGLFDTLFNSSEDNSTVSDCYK